MTAIINKSCKEGYRWPDQSPGRVNRNLKCFVTMKLTVLMLLACLQVSANGNAQITFSGKDVKLEQVFKAIEEQTEYRFFYSEELLKGVKKVTIEVRNASVEEVLRKCLEDQQLTYAINGTTIFIKKKVIKTGQLQPEADTYIIDDVIEVRGKVVNEKGEPMEGVTVRVKGKRIGTSTDSKGEFYLKDVPENGVLVFSAINIQEVEWRVGGKSEMVVTVRTKVSEEQEVEVVVNTGYQQVSRERAVGSYYVMDSASFHRRVGMNILDRLDGTVPGVLFTKKGISEIQVRGLSTLGINTSFQPLIVVDNFPMDNSFHLSNINPNDVESITVLKDAAAASIWGTRAVMA